MLPGNSRGLWHGMAALACGRLGGEEGLNWKRDEEH